MRSYHKLSKILKFIKHFLIVVLTLYCVLLATNSIFCLFDRYVCCENELMLLNFVNFRGFILDVYIATFIITSFVVLYFSRKKNYSFMKVIYIIVNSLLFLPVSALLVYNFVILGSLMSSFYLLVVFSVVIFVINQLTTKIDKLYDIAVGNNEIKEKGGKKICKEK